MGRTTRVCGGLAVVQNFAEEWDALVTVLRQEKKAGTGRVIVVVSVIVVVLVWWLLLVACGVVAY